jgi:hypothetical protein
MARVAAETAARFIADLKKVAAALRQGDGRETGRGDG